MRKLGKRVRVYKSLESVCVSLMERLREESVKKLEDGEIETSKDLDRWIEKEEQRIYELSGIDDIGLKYESEVWNLMLVLE